MRTMPSAKLLYVIEDAEGFIYAHVKAKSTAGALGVYRKSTKNNSAFRASLGNVRRIVFGKSGVSLNM